MAVGNQLSTVARGRIRDFPSQVVDGFGGNRTCYYTGEEKEKCVNKVISFVFALIVVWFLIELAQSI